MYIILEILILENFIINFLILYLTKIISRSKGNNKRLLLGAFVASLYSLAFFLPLKKFMLSIPIKFIVSILIIRISYTYINLKIFTKTVTAFYITSFIFAGATIGSFFARIGIEIYNGLNEPSNFPVFYLIFGVSISFIASKMIFSYYHSRINKENFMVDVTIYYKNNQVEIKALLDTGNSLVDPFTKKKVMVVDYNAIKDILPPNIEDLISANNEGNFSRIEKELDLLKDEVTFTMIPFKSVGKNSILIGFRADLVEINFMNGKRYSKEIIIGIYHGSLTRDMGYSGLLNFDMNWGDFDEVNEVQNQTLYL